MNIDIQDVIKAAETKNLGLMYFGPAQGWAGTVYQ